MSDDAPQRPDDPALSPDVRTTIVEVPSPTYREETLRHELAQTKKHLHRAAVSSILAVLVIAGLAVRMMTMEKHPRPATPIGDEKGAGRNEEERSKDRAYVEAMASATEDMVQGREAAVRDVLDHQRPAPGSPDRRAWEWHYADTLLNPGTSQAMASERPLWAMAVSPDEKSVAVAGEEGRITVWSTDSLALLGAWEAKGGAVHSLSWSAGGLLATALDEGGVAVWETAPPHETARWKAHSKTTTAVQWHPRDPVLISGGADGAVSMWKPSGELIHSSQCKGPVLAMDLQRDSNVMAAILGKPNRLVVAKPGEIGEAHELPLSMEGSALAWQPAGGWMVLSRHGVPVCLFNPHLKDDEGLTCLQGETIPRATAFAWLPNGKVMAVGSINGSILLSNPRDANDKPTKLNGHKGQVSGLAWLKHRDRLLSIGEDGSLRAWDEARRPVQVDVISTPCPISGARWNPVEDLLAVVLSNDELQVMDGTTKDVLWSHALPRPVDLNVPHHKASVAWSPDGKLLAVGCAGRALTLWNTTDGSRSGSLGTVIAEEVSWMPDGRRMLVKTSSGWLTLSPDGTSENISAPPGTHWLVPFSGDRRAALSADGEEVRWQFLGTGSPPPAMPSLKLSSHVICVASNPSHTKLALGAENGAVAWFDIQSSKWSRPSLAHSGPVATLAWNASGTRLASFGADGKCRIFHVGEATQTWMLNYRTNPELVGAGWNARGDKLMVACQSENRIRTFDAGRSMDREPGAKPHDQSQAHRLADVCQAIERNPGSDIGWSNLKRLLKSAPAASKSTDLDLLLATVEMGEMALFHPSDKTPVRGTKVVKKWEDQALPPAVQILQLCALGQWEAVLEGCKNRKGPVEQMAWYRQVEAEALLSLGRPNEAGKCWLQNWQTQRQAWVSDAEQDEPAMDPVTASHPSLAPWACVTRDSDWTGGDQNNLSELPLVLKQPGYEFATGSFIQMAGKSLRATSQHMFPRITDWIPLGKPAHKVAFLVSVSCFSPPGALTELQKPGTCVGSIYLRLDNGTATRVPLIYGKNVWDWWVPSNDGLAPPKDLVAWAGSNPRAASVKHSLALCRLEWETGAGEPAATDFSVSSTLRKPAPMLLGAEVVR